MVSLSRKLEIRREVEAFYSEDNLSGYQAWFAELRSDEQAWARAFLTQLIKNERPTPSGPRLN